MKNKHLLSIKDLSIKDINKILLSAEKILKQKKLLNSINLAIKI